MRKIITIASFLLSINLKSQVKIVQTLNLLKNDSCLIITKIETKDGKGYKSEAKCKFTEFDSLKLIERKRAKLISENFNWKN
jgi:hypothetical protein